MLPRRRIALLMMAMCIPDDGVSKYTNCRWLVRKRTGEEVARTVALADLHHDKRRDDGRNEAQLDLSESEHGFVDLPQTNHTPMSGRATTTRVTAVYGKGKVAGGDKARTASYCVAIDAANHRHGARIDRVEHVKQLLRVLLVFLLLMWCGDGIQGRVVKRFTDSILWIRDVLASRTEEAGTWV